MLVGTIYLRILLRRLSNKLVVWLLRYLTIECRVCGELLRRDCLLVKLLRILGNRELKVRIVLMVDQRLNERLVVLVVVPVLSALLDDASKDGDDHNAPNDDADDAEHSLALTYISALPINAALAGSTGWVVIVGITSPIVRYEHTNVITVTRRLRTLIQRTLPM